jgi:3',5'-cyclic-AMP phosphodiesterase
MTKLIVLTDLHMVPTGCTIIGLDPYIRLQSAISHINRFHADADGVVVMGDITNDGDSVSYARVKQLLAKLRPPCHAMIGNHDDRAEFRAAFPLAPVDPHGFVQSVVELADVRLILLDTVMPGQVGGRLCDDRLAWLETQLSDGQGRAALIFMHHPLHDVGFAGMDAQRLPNNACLTMRRSTGSSPATRRSVTFFRDISTGRSVASSTAYRLRYSRALFTNSR